jgi:transcription elongation factor SPT6
MEEMLVKTKREKPTFIPYFISACRDLPGKFILGYQPRGKPRWVTSHTSRHHVSQHDL